MISGGEKSEKLYTQHTHTHTHNEHTAARSMASMGALTVQGDDVFIKRLHQASSSSFFIKHLHQASSSSVVIKRLHQASSSSCVCRFSLETAVPTCSERFFSFSGEAFPSFAVPFISPSEVETFGWVLAAATKLIAPFPRPF